jgi:two-component sensor histidine kinase
LASREHPYGLKVEKIIYIYEKREGFGLPVENYGDEFEITPCLLPLQRVKPGQIPAGDIWLLEVVDWLKKEVKVWLESIIDSSKSSLIPLLIIIHGNSEEEIKHLPEHIWETHLIDIVPFTTPFSLLKSRIRKLIILAQTLIERADLVVDNRYLRKQVECSDSKLKKLVLENDTLLQEIHHRVKNNLQIISSILSLKTGGVSNPEIRDILQITQSRVDTISLIHKKLYESSDFSEIEMKDYFQQQVMDLFYTYSTHSKNINLELVVVPFSLEVSRAIHCALLVNELVINIFLHAFPDRAGGKMRVCFRLMDSDMIELIIEDNGVGLEDKIEVLKIRSVGLRLAYQLTKQLGGTLDCAVDEGTHFIICFPLNLKSAR